MSASGVADKAIEQIKNGTDFIFINFANADMVGHTANVPAIIKAVEEIDKELERVISTLIESGGVAIITADHGNAENMIDSIGLKEIANTFHTKNRVPFSLLGKEFKNKKLYSGGVLGNVAPTILDILNIEKPEEMNKRSLLK
jgi:2,3-bisphosphoglycerate-independent phosphoglycerate mutase